MGINPEEKKALDQVEMKAEKADNEAREEIKKATEPEKPEEKTARELQEKVKILEGKIEKQEREKEIQAMEKEAEESRHNYLEIRKQKGKILKESKYRGKEGKEHLEEDLKTARELYEKNLNKLRQLNVAEKLKNFEGSGEELQKEAVKLMLEEYEKEQNKMEEGAISEKTGLQKFRELFDKHPKTRMLLGFALAGGAALSMLTGQLWLTPAFITARAGLAGVGAALGTEAMLAKFSKTLGEKGLINKLAKTKDLEKNIYNLSDADVKSELIRLKAIAERKGFKLNEICGGKYGEIIKALKKRGKEILERNFAAKMSLMEKGGSQDREKMVSAAIMESLSEQNDEINREMEKKAEEERNKVLKRYVIAGTTGLVVGGLTAYIGFSKLSEVKEATARATAMMETGGTKRVVPEIIRGHREHIEQRVQEALDKQIRGTGRHMEQRVQEALDKQERN